MKRANKSLFCLFMSFVLLLGQALSPGEFSFGQTYSTQDEQKIKVAVLSFQDESGAGASADLITWLTSTLAKNLYVVSNRIEASPQPLRDNPGNAVWDVQRLVNHGQQLGAQFVIRPGLESVTSESASGFITTIVAIYADVVSVRDASIKRIGARGISERQGSGGATQADLMNPRSDDFFRSPSHHAFHRAIDSLAGSFYEIISSGSSEKETPVETRNPSGQQTSDNLSSNDAEATDDAQAAAADEDLQQLIAQAQECLNSANATTEKITALIAALEGLKSALEKKAGLLEEGRISEAEQVQQEVETQRQELEEAESNILPQETGDPLPPDPGQTGGATGGGKWDVWFDRITRAADFAVGSIDRIQDMRARYRGVMREQSDPAGAGQDNPAEEKTEPVSGVVYEEEDESLKTSRSPGSVEPRFGAPSAVRRKPVAGAEVVEPDSGQSTVTNSGGFYSLRVPARSAKLIVRKNGAQIAERRISIARGRATSADFVLNANSRGGAPIQSARVLPSKVAASRDSFNTGSISGLIADSRGNPLPRALVDLRGLAIARTDSKGKFAFTRVPTGVHQIAVQSADASPMYEQVRVNPNRVTQKEIRFDATRSSATPQDRLIAAGAGTTLRGAVSDEQNRSVAGAKVSAISTSGSASVASIRTRADGSFELKDLKPGEYRILVDKEGFDSRSQKVHLRSGGSERLSFHLRGSSSALIKPVVDHRIKNQIVEVRGQIRATNGALIPNAHVEAWPTLKTLSVARTVTNSRGEYVLRVFQGSYQLRVRQNGFREERRVANFQSRNSALLDFELKPIHPIDIEGRKADPRRGGAPPINRPTTGQLTVRVVDERTRRPIADAIVSVEGRRYRTDRFGNCVVANLEQGEYPVVVGRDGYESEGKRVKIKAGSSGQQDFELRPKEERSRTYQERPGAQPGQSGKPTPGTTAQQYGALTGQVTDSRTGKPISGVIVSIRGRKVGTDRNGYYEMMELNPGVYEVHVSSRGYLSESNSIRIESGRSVKANFRLSPTTLFKR